MVHRLSLIAYRVLLIAYPPLLMACTLSSIT